MVWQYEVKGKDHNQIKCCPKMQRDKATRLIRDGKSVQSKKTSMSISTVYGIYVVPRKSLNLILKTAGEPECITFTWLHYISGYLSAAGLPRSPVD